jgi:trehalose 6-phosphate phosphatase
MIRHARDRIEAWAARRMRDGHLLVALDFDGTLAPIVPVPDDAAILPAAHDALAELAARADTRVAIVSGRGLEDVRRRVGLDTLHYAGNHGLEIDGPHVRQVHADAAQARPALDTCARRLEAEVATIDGVLVEDKGLTLSVHYRRVDDDAVASEVVRRVRALCGNIEGVRLTEGKKVVEIRPDVEWDKGRATTFLVDRLMPGGGHVVFIGDDRTDEDAFRALDGRGEGVIVADPPPADTAAASFVRSPAEVADVLARLARA